MTKRKGQTRTLSKAPPPRTPEERFQRQVVAHLRIALPGAIVVHAANERTASREQGMVPGYPDLVVHWRGITFCVELKAGANRLRKSQNKTLAAIAEQGVDVFVLADGDPAALTRLTEWAKRVDTGQFLLRAGRDLTAEVRDLRAGR